MEQVNEPPRVVEAFIVQGKKGFFVLFGGLGAQAPRKF